MNKIELAYSLCNYKAISVRVSVFSKLVLSSLPKLVLCTCSVYRYVRCTRALQYSICLQAFAAQYLAVEKELGLPRDRTNVDGGALAVGHPLGASGSRIAAHLVHELRFCVWIRLFVLLHILYTVLLLTNLSGLFKGPNLSIFNGTI